MEATQKTTPGTAAGDGRFREARREVSGLTAGVERRTLRWLAQRTPKAIHSDHLTLLGLFGMAACGLLYALCARHPWLLALVPAALAVNWLGDSLDGTLARHRNRQRPRFGFYVDHLVDVFGVLLVLVGLGLSGLMTPLVAAGLLVAYYLVALESYLATYALGTFRISWGPVGGTELRILLAIVSLAVLRWPTVEALGREVRTLDLVAVPATAALAILAVAAGIRGTRELLRLEGPAGGGQVLN